MKVLVTGGAGFIGSEIASFHSKRGDLVWVIDDLSTGRLENLDFPIFRFDQEDITLGNAFKEALEWAEWIYHMAAVVGQSKVLLDPFTALQKNVESTQALFKWAKPNHRIFFASSASAYWFGVEGDGVVQEDCVLKIPSGNSFQKAYMLSKIFGENLAQLSSCFTVIGRLFNIYGKNQQSLYGSVIPRMIEQSKKQKPITIYGDGSQRRSFLHVQDAVRYIYLLMKNASSKGQIYNIGSSDLICLSDLALLIKEVTESASEIQYIEYKKAYGVEFIEAENIVPSFAKTWDLTHYFPEFDLKTEISKIAK